MTAVARMAVLNLRTVAPYRFQALGLFAVVVALLSGKPVVLVPALVLVFNSVVAYYPFVVGDKANLETLYGTLPLPRRTVLLGHYAWALGTFVVTGGLATVAAVVVARVQSVEFGGRTLLMVLTAAWALFAVNVAIPFPLCIRYGYSRISMLGTTLPLAAIMLAVGRLHLGPSVEPSPAWLALGWAGGAAALAASVAVAIAADRRR